MSAAEPRQRRKQERRANIARRFSRLLAQSLRSEDFTRMISEKQKTLTAAKPQGVSTDHSGASPVASALGIRLGAPPGGRNYTNTHSEIPRLKGDILTLLEKGTFSFCLGTYCLGVDRG